MADGIEARARQLKQLKRDRGVPVVKPRPVRVELLDHVLEPLGPLLDDGPCPEGAICFSMVVVPSGLHLPQGNETKWHPTGETYPMEVDGEILCVTRGRQVPNFVTTEAGAAAVNRKPSKVEPGPLATGDVARVEREVVSPDVTAAEIAMARAEAKAMRVDYTTPEERRIWGGIASRRADRRVDTTWLWGNGGERVVRSPVMPTSPAKA